MSNKVKIIADCICDLSPELIEKYDIEIIPLIVNIGDTTYYDGVDTSPDAVYAYYESTGKLARTAAIPPAFYADYYKKWKLLGYDIVHIVISTEFSAAFNNATIAKQDFEGIFPIASQNLSTGTGHLVIEAGIMAQNGASAKEISDKLTELIPKINASFILNTLEFLWKGGRCSGVAALGANILKLKPCIELQKGKMEVGKKYRGNLNSVHSSYIQDKLKDKTDIVLDRVFITNSGGFSNDEIEAVKKEVIRLQPFKEVHITRAGCSVSCHCGPRTLGVLFINK